MALEDYLVDTQFGKRLDEKRFYYAYSISVNGAEYANVSPQKVEFVVVRPNGDDKPDIIGYIHSYKGIDADNVELLEDIGFLVLKAKQLHVIYKIEHSDTNEYYPLDNEQYSKYKA